MIITPAYASTTHTAMEHSLFQDPTFWVGVAFFITVITLIKLAGKAVLSYLDARAEKISNQLKEAKELRQKAQEMLMEYKERYNKIELERARSIKEAEDHARQLKENIRQDFETKIHNQELVAQQRLERAKQETMEEIRDLAIRLTIQTTEQLLLEKLSADKDQRLINDAIDSLQECFSSDKAA